MSLYRWVRHQYQKKTLVIVLTGTVAINAPFAAEALAFESILPHAVATQLTVPVQMAGRDPYLTLAIDNLPAYSHSEIFPLRGQSDPTTAPGNWPEPKRVAIAKKTSTPVIPAPVVAGGPVVLQGEASYYSRAGCLGCNPGRIMANGQPLRDEALTMAIGANLKHLVGRKAKVTNIANGKSVEVRITDTGGFYQAKYGRRVADLTVGTKQAIGIAGGVGQVKVEVY